MADHDRNLVARNTLKPMGVVWFSGPPFGLNAESLYQLPIMISAAGSKIGKPVSSVYSIMETPHKDTVLVLVACCPYSQTKFRNVDRSGRHKIPLAGLVGVG